jgi:hypothetical protein
MKKINNKILRIHAWFLMALTITNTIMSLIGTFKGIGPYNWLHSMPLVEAGLYQAYLLMFLLAVVLLLNANRKDVWKYNLIAILAHMVALSVNFIFKETIQNSGFGNLSTFSIAIHSSWIFTEAIGLFLSIKSSNNNKMD